MALLHPARLLHITQQRRHLQADSFRHADLRREVESLLVSMGSAAAPILLPPSAHEHGDPWNVSSSSLETKTVAYTTAQLRPELRYLTMFIRVTQQHGQRLSEGWP